MDDEIEFYLKELSEDVHGIPFSTDPRAGTDRRKRHTCHFPLKLDSGGILRHDRRGYADRRNRATDVSSTQELKVRDLEALETSLGISAAVSKPV